MQKTIRKRSEQARDKTARSNPTRRVKNTWQIQQAKDRFSALVQSALEHGPQTITRHGKPVVYVVSQADFKQPGATSSKPLGQFFRESPLFGVELDLTRNRTPSRRTIEL